MALYIKYAETREIARSLIALPKDHAIYRLEADGFTPAEACEIVNALAGARTGLVHGPWEHIYNTIRGTIATSIRIGDRLPDEEVPEL